MLASRFDLPGTGARLAPRSATRGLLIGLGLACAAPLAAQPAGTGVGSQFELVFWQSVATSEDPDQYAAYLSRYPDGTFAAVARAKIERLRPASAPSPAATVQPAPAPPVEPAARIAPPAATVAPVLAIPAPTSPAPVAAPAVAIAAPVVAPVDVPAPAVPAASAPAASAPAASASPPVAPPGPAPAPAPPPSLAEQLAALAGSQGHHGEAAADRRAMPGAPDLPAPDPVVLPAQFCSAVERNAFYDEQFRPSKDAADENNRRAIAHLRDLQALYDRLGQEGDPDGQNAISAESKAYQPVAAAAYQTSAGYDRIFQQLMAVPITACAAPEAVPAKERKRS